MASAHCRETAKHQNCCPPASKAELMGHLWTKLVACSSLLGLKTAALSKQPVHGTLGPGAEPSVRSCAPIRQPRTLDLCPRGHKRLKPHTGQEPTPL